MRPAGPAKTRDRSQSRKSLAGRTLRSDTQVRLSGGAFRLSRQQPPRAPALRPGPPAPPAPWRPGPAAGLWGSASLRLVFEEELEKHVGNWGHFQWPFTKGRDEGATRRDAPGSPSSEGAPRPRFPSAFVTDAGDVRFYVGRTHRPDGPVAPAAVLSPAPEGQGPRPGGRGCSPAPRAPRGPREPPRRRSVVAQNPDYTNETAGGARSGNDLPAVRGGNFRGPVGPSLPAAPLGTASRGAAPGLTRGRRRRPLCRTGERVTERGRRLASFAALALRGGRNQAIGYIVSRIVSLSENDL